MRRIMPFIFLLLVGCQPVSEAGPGRHPGLEAATVSAPSSSITRGAFLAQTYCAACHAVGLKDVSRLEGAPAFRDLQRRYPVSQLEEALAEGIVTAHPDMPRFAFEAHDVTALVDYLESLEN